MHAFAMMFMLLLFVGVTRIAFQRVDMISALVIALASASLMGGLLEVSAGGNGALALEILGLGFLFAPVLALDRNPLKGGGSVLSSCERYAGMSCKVEAFAPKAVVRHSFAA